MGQVSGDGAGQVPGTVRTRPGRPGQQVFLVPVGEQVHHVPGPDAGAEDQHPRRTVLVQGAGRRPQARQRVHDDAGDGLRLGEVGHDEGGRAQQPVPGPASAPPRGCGPCGTAPTTTDTPAGSASTCAATAATTGAVPSRPVTTAWTPIPCTTLRIWAVTASGGSSQAGPAPVSGSGARTTVTTEAPAQPSASIVRSDACTPLRPVQSEAPITRAGERCRSRRRYVLSWGGP